MPANKPAKRPAKTPARKATTKAATKPAKKPAARTPAAGPGLAEVLRLLEKAGSEQTRKIYERHGARGPMFGVRFGDLFDLMKRIDVDHALARELWATGNVDARNLAMKIADPGKITSAELDRWAIENPMPMCALYVATLAVESPHGLAKVREWLAAADDRLHAMGWTTLARISDLDGSFPEDELLRRVAEIERRIHEVPDQVRAEMNRALIAIGGRSPALRKAVIAAARRIGPVEVGHGDTACRTPDAAQAIEKAWARAGKKFPSPAEHERSMKSMRRRC